MDDSTQIIVPDSFLALYTRPGSFRLTASREEIAARYELCEDLAQMLTQQAADRQFELGVEASDVLTRIDGGLRADGSPVTPAEAGWAVRRLAELLGWPDPQVPADAGPP